MIEKMLKVTILFHRSMRERFLEELQELGVLHIENYGVKLTQEVQALQERTTRISGLRKQLSAVCGGEVVAAATPADRQYPGGVDALSEAVNEIRAGLETLNEERASLTQEIFRVTRFGDFDPAQSKALAEAGYGMQLYSASKSSLQVITERITSQDLLAVEPVLEERGTIYFVLFYPLKPGLPDIGATKENLPEASLEALNARLAALDSELESLRDRLSSYVRYLPWLSEVLRAMKNDLASRMASESLTNEVDGHALAVTGWVPNKAHPSVNEFLNNQEVVYVFEEAEREDVAPILLSNNRYARLFEPILRIFSLPDYRELDTTPYFAPFYTLFFGLCIADLGYGIVLSLAMLIALVVLPRASNIRPIVALGLVLSLSVLICGILLNDFFGLKLSDVIGAHNFLQALIFFKDSGGPMLFAIMLGIVQVIFGYVLKTVNQVRIHGPLGALKPTGVVMLLLGIVLIVLHTLGPSFAIGPFQFGRWAALVPNVSLVGLGLIGAGLLLILLFNSLEKKIFLRPLLGLWELYELASGIPGDILSYLRLFALGLAGGLLAEAIVHIALMVRGSSPLGIIPMVIILLFGTGLNLAIGLLSAFVHSLRLTFVEFYKAVGFKGGGVEYTPFRKTR